MCMWNISHGSVKHLHVRELLLYCGIRPASNALPPIAMRFPGIRFLPYIISARRGSMSPGREGHKGEIASPSLIESLLVGCHLSRRFGERGEVAQAAQVLSDTLIRPAVGTHYGRFPLRPKATDASLFPFRCS